MDLRCYLELTFLIELQLCEMVSLAVVGEKQGKIEAAAASQSHLYFLWGGWGSANLWSVSNSKCRALRKWWNFLTASSAQGWSWLSRCISAALNRQVLTIHRCRIFWRLWEAIFAQTSKPKQVLFFFRKSFRESRGSSAEEFCYFDGRSGLLTLCISATINFLFSVIIFSNLNNPNKKLAIPSN